MKEALVGWIRRRLSPGQFFGLQLTLGVFAFILAAWLFGWLAEDVSRDEPITELDSRIALWWSQHQRPGLARFLSFVSWAHTWPIGVSGAAFLAFLLWHRRWKWAIVASTTVVGGMALNTLLKLAFHRERPTFSGLASALHTYSFPSGHTLGATVIYSVLAAYAIARTRSPGARVSIGLGALMTVCLVAFSRIYLGVHYLSDVLAAAAEGIAWFALCYTATDTLIARWKRRHVL